MIALFQISSILQPTPLFSILADNSEIVPKSLLKEILSLKKRLRKTLLMNVEDLEAIFENMLPKVWELRVKAFQVISKFDILLEASTKAEADFASIPQKKPELTATVQKLDYGFQLMTEFLKAVLQSPEHAELVFEKLGDKATQIPSFDQICNEMEAAGDKEMQQALKQFLHGSTMMELLILAVDLAAEEDLPLEFNMYHELEYQSAVAVKSYAKFLGVEETKLPWYKSPTGDFQKMLIGGPVLAASDFQFVHERSAHLNSWR